MTQIAQNLLKVQQNIASAAQKAGRLPSDLTLVAVSKTHPEDAVAEAIKAGQRVFGENRVQEARGKYSTLKTRFPDLELHLIGPLQSNKAGEAVALFDVIQTVDRPGIAQELAKEMKRQRRNPKLYIEVNIGREPQKAGIDPDGLGDFLSFCQDDLGLDICGLMCIPPAQDDPTPHFARLKQLADQFGLANISMGMSADYEKAIAHGATHVRVGTAIFGARDT